MLLLYQQYDGIYLLYNSGGYAFVLQLFQIPIFCFSETGGTTSVPPVDSGTNIQAAGAVLW